MWVWILYRLARNNTKKLQYNFWILLNSCAIQQEKRQFAHTTTSRDKYTHRVFHIQYRIWMTLTRCSVHFVARLRFFLYSFIHPTCHLLSTPSGTVYTPAKNGRQHSTTQSAIMPKKLLHSELNLFMSLYLLYSF